ncbi:MAG: DUF4230 domain-containing protein [Sandaracinaceae bacterium]
MSEREPSAPRERVTAPLRTAAWVLLVVIGACLGGAVLTWVARIVSPAPETPDETIVIRPGADVVVAVRDLARLESASFHMERVIDMSDRQRRVFGLVHAEDSILLVAAADVVAGVDLSHLAPEDVEVSDDGARVRITVPPAEIFSARLDNDRTYVQQRSTDLLARREDRLETRARQEAERALREAAIEAGIQARAQENAERTLTSLLRSLGFREVEVEVEVEVGPASARPPASTPLR